MANYDSDTSSEGGDDYTTTNVTLGYASSESYGDDISHIGGHPVCAFVLLADSMLTLDCRHGWMKSKHLLLL